MREVITKLEYSKGGVIDYMIRGDVYDSPKDLYNSRDRLFYRNDLYEVMNEINLNSPIIDIYSTYIATSKDEVNFVNDMDEITRDNSDKVIITHVYNDVKIYDIDSNEKNKDLKYIEDLKIKTLQNIGFKLVTPIIGGYEDSETMIYQNASGKILTDHIYEIMKKDPRYDNIDYDKL